MTAPLRRSLAWAAVCAVAATLSAGCQVGPRGKAGAGESVDVCHGLQEYNTLAEPVLTDGKQVQSYVAAAQRVLARIDPKLRYKNLSGAKRPVPADVAVNLAGERSAYATMRAQVSAATTPVALRTAVTGFTTSATFGASDTALELWASNNCG